MSTELISATRRLRAAQRNYLANRTERNGQLVAEAAAWVDIALEKLEGPRVVPCAHTDAYNAAVEQDRAAWLKLNAAAIAFMGLCAGLVLRTGFSVPASIGLGLLLFFTYVHIKRLPRFLRSAS